MKLLATSEEVDRLKEYASTFVTKNYIDSFKNEITPIVDKSKELLDQFVADNEEMKKCVIKFDETICLKADRWQLKNEII